MPEELKVNMLTDALNVGLPPLDKSRLTKTGPHDAESLRLRTIRN